MAYELITVDAEMAHVILGAFSVCSSEGIHGVAIKPVTGCVPMVSDLDALHAEGRVIGAVSRAYPEVAKIYGQPDAINALCLKFPLGG